MKTGLFKKIGLSLLAIIWAVGILLSGWFVYIKYFAPEKIIGKTFEVGLQTIKDGTQKHFIEVDYKSNENGNGLECLDIKFNVLMDENQESFFSQGIQLVANSKTDKIDFKFKHDKDQRTVYYNRDKGLFRRVDYEAMFGSWFLQDCKMFNYMSNNDFATVLASSNPLNDDSTFLIQLGKDLFKMKFKGTTNEYFGEYNFYRSETKTNWLGSRNVYEFYYYLNLEDFCRRLYQSIQVLPNGTTNECVFEFGNLFKYYAYDADKGQYKEETIKDSTKVVADMKSYYSIFVKKSADGIQKASESLFKCVAGSTTYNTTQDYTEGEYFIGRTVLDLNIFDFDLVNVAENVFALKLKKNFVDIYKKNANAYWLRVDISLDIFKQKGLEFFGFTSDSGLDDFTIIECFTSELVDGVLIKKEIDI